MATEGGASENRMMSFTHIETHWFYAMMPYRAGEAIFSLLFLLFLLDVLHAHVGTVGLLTGLISLTAVPGSILWGYLSDHLHKRREILILGYIGSGLCLVGMGLASNLTLMVFLCRLYGLFSIAPGPIPAALIMETMPQERWDEAFGTFNKPGDGNTAPGQNAYNSGRLGCARWYFWASGASGPCNTAACSSLCCWVSTSLSA